MDAATVSPPRAGAALDRPRRRARRRRPPDAAPRRRARHVTCAARARAAAGVACALRLWGVKQGLPYSYNVDEATHFVPAAVAFFGHDLNPHYFLNPPAYSYLLHIVFELWFGSADAVARAYATDPTRGVRGRPRGRGACSARSSVWLTYLAGARLFDRTVGLLAAAILGARVPAGLLQPPGAQRRPDAGAGGALAVRDRGGAAPRAAGATT